MQPPLIQFINVSKRFGNIDVLKDTTFSIHEGEVTTVIGKSGEGKENLLARLDQLLS